LLVGVRTGRFGKHVRREFGTEMFFDAQSFVALPACATGLVNLCAVVGSEFESVVAVTAAVTFVFVLAGGCGVDLGCGVGYFAEAVDELVAALE
jgi:hypothetical protein